MYTLRLLGTAVIEASHGPVAGRAAQGRRLGLLAVVALARGRPVLRDKLVGLLWPETTQERARAQLSDTLYILRHTLGQDVVRSTGDGITLDPAALTSDVALFERRLADGELEQAVALYRGPLLDGFHVPDSTEFESWLDGERAQLYRQFTEAVEKLAEAAEAAGRADVALGWWRRRAAHDPLNGRVALRLMRALEAAGDRAGALQHARIHAELFRQEFDADPDPGIDAYAEQLRREPAPAPQPAEPPVRATAPQLAEPPVRATAPQAAEPPVTPPVATSAMPVAASAPPPAASVAPVVRRRRFTPLAAAAVLVLVLIAGAFYAARSRAAPSAARSIGVLPFVNMSPDPANTYFSDGLSEQIILALSRIDGLRVAARTSSFALRDRDLNVRAIGDTLDVQAVLEGSVLVDGEKLRVIAQLIDARTGYHIWSEQYDGARRDVFAVQDSVANAIAGALHLRLALGPGGAAQRAPSLEAYDFYLRGLHLRSSLSGDVLRQALDYFDRAIALEPRFALAWAAKASVVAPLAYFRHADRDSVAEEVRRLTTRALELDPTISEAHVSFGILKLFFDWEWPAAETALRRAIELNPSDAHAWHHLGNYYAAMGAPEAARDAREEAVRLDPLNPRTRIVLAGDYLVTQDFERALEQARRAQQLDPAHALLLGLGPDLPAGAPEILLRMGRLDEAFEEYMRVATLRTATADELNAMRQAYATGGMPAFWMRWIDMERRQFPSNPDPVRLGSAYLQAGDTAQALDLLDQAYAERNPGLIYLQRRPLLVGMTAHPRIARIARAMKLRG